MIHGYDFHLKNILYIIIFLYKRNQHSNEVLSDLCVDFCITYLYLLIYPYHPSNPHANTTLALFLPETITNLAP